MHYSLEKRAIAEAAGTAILPCAIAGSTIALQNGSGSGAIAGIAGSPVAGAASSATWRAA